MDTNILNKAPSVASIQEQITKTRDAAIKLGKVKAKMAELMAPIEEFAADQEKILAAMMKAAKVDNLEVQSTIGTNIRAEFVPRQAPKVEDWELFYEWIHEHKRYDMLHKRASSAPVVELFQLAQSNYTDAEEQLFATVHDFAAAKYLPKGVVVSEWKELKLSETKPKKPRRAAG